MKLSPISFLIGYLTATIICVAISLFALNYNNDYYEEKENRIRLERNMYDSLYRSANTRLYQFQDSINKHCICK